MGLEKSAPVAIFTKRMLRQTVEELWKVESIVCISQPLEHDAIARASEAHVLYE